MSTAKWQNITGSKKFFRLYTHTSNENVIRKLLHPPLNCMTLICYKVYLLIVFNVKKGQRNGNGGNIYNAKLNRAPNPWCLMVFGSTLEGARWAFPSYSNLMKLASFLGKPINWKYFWISIPTLRFLLYVLVLLYVLFWFLVDCTVHFHYCITLPIIRTVWKKSGSYC